MKNCTDCKYADWKRNADGKLHRSGDGKCTYKVKMPVLPAAFFFSQEPITLCGGFINRKEDWNKHCPYYLAEPIIQS